MDNKLPQIANSQKPATDWVSVAAGELDKLMPPHERKKRNTVIALIAARLNNQPEESVWKKPGTCSRNTWHAKWKHDETVNHVLESAWAIAQTWIDTAALNYLKVAQEKLAKAAPKAVDRAVEVMVSEDDNLALKASFGILDRAGIETAPKTAVEHNVPAVEDMINRVYGSEDAPADAVDQE